MKECKPYGDYPRYFLASTQEEAERLFLEYSPLLNGISYTYSMATGIEKGELFGEAIMGLATALKNFDGSLDYSFKTYAVKVIKSFLSDYARRNSYTIYIPAYIKRANKLIARLKSVLHQAGVSEDEATRIISEGNLELSEIPTKFVESCRKIINLLEKEAKRASINYKKLVNRSEHVPVEVELTDETIEQKHACFENERELEIALFVEKLKEHMTDEELSICEGIMNDKTYEAIAKEHGRTAPWVHQKLLKLKKKLEKRLREKKRVS